MTSSLILNSVDLSFGKKQVLSDVSLTCSTGDILAIFGRNGSGKSTLLKILFGTLRPKTMELYINGNRVERVSTKSKQVAYLPQAPFIPKDLTARQIIPMYFRDGATQDRIFYTPLINKIERQRFGSLSLGEQKYLELLLVVNLPHPFILLDEPFAMLEPLHIESVKGILNSHKKDKGIIITDHYYRDVFEISSRQLIIKDGISHEISSLNELCEYGYLPLPKGSLTEGCGLG